MSFLIMPSMWHLRNGNKELGIFTESDLKKMVAEKNIHAEYLLKSEHDSDWKAAYSLPWLFPPMAKHFVDDAKISNVNVPIKQLPHGGKATLPTFMTNPAFTIGGLVVLSLIIAAILFNRSETKSAQATSVANAIPTVLDRSAQDSTSLKTPQEALNTKAEQGHPVVVKNKVVGRKDNALQDSMPRSNNNTKSNLVLLSNKYKVGDKDIYEREMSETVDVYYSDESARGGWTNTKLFNKFSNEVVSIEDNGDITINRKIIDLTMYYKDSINREYSFGTAGKTGDVPPSYDKADELYKAISGSVITIVQSNKGEVKDVRLPKNILDALGTNSKSQMTPEQFKSLINLKSEADLPKEPISVGHKWSTTSTLESPQPIKSTLTWEYIGKINDNGVYLDKIDFKKNIEIKFKHNTDFDTKMQVNNSTGQLLFDNDRGKLIMLTMELDVETKMVRNSDNGKMITKAKSKHVEKLVAR